MVVQASFTVPLDEDGRIILPDEVRHELGVEPGDVLVLQLEDGALRILSAREIVQRAAGIYKDVAAGRSMVDELIAERREEALRDDEGARMP